MHGIDLIAVRHAAIRHGRIEERRRSRASDDRAVFAAALRFEHSDDREHFG
jgi:hypothetical protein